MNNQISIESIVFSWGNLSDICRQIITMPAPKKEARIVLPCSLNDLAQRAKSAHMKSAYGQVDVFLPDGMPLVWMLRSRGLRTDRIYGPDLMFTILRSKKAMHFRHVFYGSSKETLNVLRGKIKRLGIQGKCLFISPPYRSLTNREEHDFVSQIRAFKPAFLWIGISSPKQIMLAASWKKKLPGITIFCVGAAFDILAGTVPQAPPPMQRMGLEWLFRLMVRPQKLWKRYLVEIPVFLAKRILVRR